MGLHFFLFFTYAFILILPRSWRYSFFTHFNFLALFFENIFWIFLSNPDHLSFLPSFNYFTPASPPAHFFAFWLQNHTSPTFNTSPFLPPLKYFTHFKIFPSLPTGFQILSLIKIQLLAFLEKRKKRIIFKSSSFLLHATSTHYPRLVFPNDFVFFWSILKAKANWMIKLRECGTNRN